MDPPEGTVLEPDLFPDKQCRLIIIGKTGNGKSSTGNSIIGKKVFVPQVGINSGTKIGDLQSTWLGRIQIQVMDTPGLHDTEVGDDETSKKITQSLLAIHPGPHAIVLCLSCDQRFTQEEVQVYKALKDIFGENMTAHLIIVLSKRDVLEEKSQCFETQLARCAELKKVVEEAGNRYVLFDNRESLSAEKKREQVEQLLAQVQKVVVLNAGEYFKHKLTAMLNESMIRLKEAEKESESESNVYNRLDHRGQGRQQDRQREKHQDRQRERQQDRQQQDRQQRRPQPRARTPKAQEEPREKTTPSPGAAQERPKDRRASTGWVGGDDKWTSTLPQSVMVLKEKKQVAEMRTQFETATQQQELTREEIASKFQRRPRSGDGAATRRAPLGTARRSGLSPQPENSHAPVGGARETEEARWRPTGEKRDRQAGRPKAQPARPQGRPPRRPLGTPAGTDTAPQGTAPQDTRQQDTPQDTTPQDTAPQGKAPVLNEDPTTLPEKPPRSYLTSPTQPERNNNLEDMFKRFGFSSDPPTTTEVDGYSRIAESFVYEVPDRPGMRFSHKMRMVDERLKQRLARGGGELNPEQQKELEKTSRSLGQKLKEAAAKFKVEKLDKCSVM